MKRGASVKSVEMWEEEHTNILDVVEALHDHEHVVDANAEAEEGEYGVHRGVPVIKPSREARGPEGPARWER